MKVAQGAGLAPAKAILAVILPAWTPGLIQSAVLTLGRSLAETAALLFTAGYVMRMPQSIFDPGRTVSVHIFELVMNTPGGNQRALAASAVMLGALFAIHVMAARMQERLHRNHL
jgi:phosphate transport system permease protein